MRSQRRCRYTFQYQCVHYRALGCKQSAIALHLNPQIYPREAQRHALLAFCGALRARPCTLLPEMRLSRSENCLSLRCLFADVKRCSARRKFRLSSRRYEREAGQTHLHTDQEHSRVCLKSVMLDQYLQRTAFRCFISLVQLRQSPYTLFFAR